MISLSKLFRAIFAATLLALLPTGTFAQTTPYKWIFNVNITFLEPYLENYVYIQIDQTIDCSDVGGPSSTDKILLSAQDLPASEDGVNRIYSGLLAAQFAGRSVHMRVKGRSDGAYCLLERVRTI